MKNKESEINYRNIIIAIIYALFTFIVINSSGKIPTIEEALELVHYRNDIAIFLGKLCLSIDCITVIDTLIFICIIAVYYRYINKLNFNFITYIVASLFSIFMIFGFSFYTYDSWDYVFSNSFQIVFSIIQYIGWNIIFYFLLSYLFEIVGNKKWIFNECKCNIALKKAMIFIAICWLPIILVFLPSSFHEDAVIMLNSYCGEIMWTTHHPPFPTIILGIIMELGKFLGSANIGAIINLTIQFAMLLIALYYLLNFMSELKINKSLYVISIIFFACCPIFAVSVQTVVKDTLNLAFYIIYIVMYLKILLDSEWLNKKRNFWLFLIIGILVCAYRNTGVYLVVISEIILLSYYLFNKKTVLELLVIKLLLCVVIMMAFNGILVPKLGIVPGSKGEILSIPFQQTARYIKEYPEDITEQEKNAIDNLLKYDVLAERYNPNLSNPVKVTMHSEDKKDIMNYMKAWLSMFKKHPAVYFEAMLNHTSGYWYPDCISKIRNTGNIFYINSMQKLNEAYDVQYMNNDEIRNIFRIYVDEVFRKIPILGLCYNVGIYNWIWIICIALLIRNKKYYAIVGFVPVVLTFLFCIASPVNGHVRYMLPIIAVTFLMIVWTIYAIRNFNEG